MSLSLDELVPVAAEAMATARVRGFNSYVFGSPDNNTVKLEVQPLDLLEARFVVAAILDHLGIDYEN